MAIVLISLSSTLSLLVPSPKQHELTVETDVIDALLSARLRLGSALYEYVLRELGPVYVDDRELLLKVESLGEESGELMGVVDGDATSIETTNLRSISIRLS